MPALFTSTVKKIERNKNLQNYEYMQSIWTQYFITVYIAGAALEWVQWVQLNPWVFENNTIELKDFMEPH